MCGTLHQWGGEGVDLDFSSGAGPHAWVPPPVRCPAADLSDGKRDIRRGGVSWLGQNTQTRKLELEELLDFLYFLV